MTMAKKLPLLAPSIHTFEVNGTYTDCEAKRTVFMAIQKMVSAGKYYRILNLLLFCLATGQSEQE